MSGQLAESGSIISVTPVEPFDVVTVSPNSQRHMRVVAYGIAVDSRSTWVVATYATALVMAPDGTLMPIKHAMAGNEEVSGDVYD